MPLLKTNTNVSFAQGLDTKTDSKQVQLGKFLELNNSVFDKGGLLQKRNGYATLSNLPNDTTTYLTTFGNNLTALGTSLQAYNEGSASWVDKGQFTALSISILPVVRSALNQTQSDACVADNGLVCTVYTEVNNGTAAYKYTVADSTTGQSIINPTVIPVASGVVTGSPRVFLFGGYFLIVFTNVISTVSHLQYVTVSVTNPTVVSANADLASSYVAQTTLSWDGVVVGSKFFFAYNTTTGSQHIAISYLSSSFVVATPTIFAGSICTIMSMCVDNTTPSSPVIYAPFYDKASTTGFAVAVDQNLNKLMTATEFVTSGTIDNLACTAQNGILTVAYEVDNTYNYGSNLPTNYIDTVTITKPATVTTGTVGSALPMLRSVGLVSKAFLMNGTMYVFVAYESAIQSTYFLSDITGNIISRFAYENGGGYYVTGLPQTQVNGTSVTVAYLYKDLVDSVAVSLGSQGAPGTSNIYSQTGVNLGTFDFSSATLSISETGRNLNISGGLLWAYDGQTLNEQGFNVFPDNISAVSSATGGSMTHQQYYYQVTYEWTDAQGNIFRSTPSIPVTVTLTSTDSVDLNIPYLRLTYKADVKVIIYRWSTANQVYYQITSLTSPILNDPTTDSFAYNDGQADSSIVGNSILYTTGGVVEDVGGPSSTATTLFDSRLWLIDAEDKNLLWYSKQVIENTPVEMSDLFTIFVSPTIGSQGSTGEMQCLFPMDDKIVIFKANAAYYINGTGPDNTGANSQYSQPTFITSTVGCANQNSLVLTPQGIMFQSNKGIWLLGRDLSTTYIGAPVEAYNGYTVNSALNVPGTNQIRFTLSSGDTLVYDLFYEQWSTFSGVPAVSSTLFNNLHTYVNAVGQVAQETPGLYLDNGNPVLLNFTTSWINLAGLQGYQRIYFFYLLGTYFTPCKLQCLLAYDYNPAIFQSTIVAPTNYTPNYGGDDLYGQNTPYGGPGNILQWKVFTEQMRCQAFQLTVQEIYDPTFGATAGQGLNLSGIDIVFGAKKGWRPIAGVHQTS